MNNEIARRRTFAIISHPDAGKTTLTEKLLLFGGQIQVAGAVKSNKIKKTATSDWMEIEKQRGISVTTSVMEFDYEGYKVNILDTPGHQDFAEDTFRTLTAVDSVIIVVDSAKGVETQTRRLMEVCRMRKTPVIIFVNKMDREGRDAFDLLDELEAELQIAVRPLSWPIGQGARFKGVYNIYEQKLDLYTPSKQVVTEKVEVDIHAAELDERIGAAEADKLRTDLELVDGVSPSLESFVDMGVDDQFRAGKLAMCFTGSWNMSAYTANEVINGKFDLCVLPKGKVRASIYNGLGYAGSANTKYPEVVKDFIKYCGSEEANILQAQNKAAIPAYEGTEHYFTDLFTDINISCYTEMIEYGVQFPFSPNKSLWEGTETELMTSAYTGAITFAEACDQLHAAIMEIEG